MVLVFRHYTITLKCFVPNCNSDSAVWVRIIGHFNGTSFKPL